MPTLKCPIPDNNEAKAELERRLREAEEWFALWTQKWQDEPTPETVAKRVAKEIPP